MDKIIAIVISLLLVSCVATKPATEAPTESTPQAEVRTVPYTELLTLTEEYPHNTESFTQGLFFYNGIMYESTGRYGESKLYKGIDIKSGQSEMSYAFDNQTFAEGSAVLDGTLYVLTYKQNKAYTFHPETLEMQSTIKYPREGWGLTTDGEQLIASDGTPTLYFMDGSLNVLSTVTVTRNGTPLKNINELEYINGEIWANIWQSDEIVIIDPKTGEVTQAIDFKDLYTPENPTADTVLNGIAYNESNGKIYITGKYWGKMFELEIK